MAIKRSYHYDMPRIAPGNASEIAIQASCIRRVEAQFKARMIAVPNGTYIASKAGRGKATREGRSKGFPDCLIIGYGPNSGMIAFAELKARSALDPSQDAWLTTITISGFDAGVFRSQDTLADFLIARGWR